MSAKSIIVIDAVDSFHNKTWAASADRDYFKNWSKSKSKQTQVFHLAKPTKDGSFNINFILFHSSVRQEMT